MEIQLGKTLDVEVVEGQLAELWQQTAGEGNSEDDLAVLRARVANLLVFVATDELSSDVHALLPELTAIHPSRVLIMVGARSAPDSDIQMSVESFCQTDKRTGVKRLCCEEVTLKAQGNFVAELPSAALPLLVSDLSTFLWWRDALRVSDKVFENLIRAADRLVIDSAEFADPKTDLVETFKLFHQDNWDNVGISDLNWARLTYWRALLADFFDVPAYQQWLEKIDYVSIDYVGPARQPNAVAPQALLFAGWLASRLGWKLESDPTPETNAETLSLRFSSDGPGTIRTEGRERSPTEDRGSSPTDPGISPAVTESFSAREIKLKLNRVDGGEYKPGRLVRVELRTNADQPASFTVVRSADNLHLVAEAKLGSRVNRGRVLPVRNRSAAQLLSREMEILCNDRIYEEALAVATMLIDGPRSTRFG